MFNFHERINIDPELTMSEALFQVLVIFQIFQYFMNFTGDCGSVYLELRKKTFTGIYRFDILC